jgi:2-haloacid dehalogenase
MSASRYAQIKALTFDVFGTAVDYRSTIIREGGRLNATRGLTVDWARFADAWRGQYRPNIDRVARGELPWMNLDALHRRALDELLAQFGITTLTEEEIADLNRVWHRLEPWPDAVAGLERLRQRYIVATLSNGNVSLLVNMAKHSGLPWDCILSAELARVYKPDPAVYHMAAGLLGLRPEQVMMVAAHQSDLRAAQAQGLRAAFVSRPLEHGPDAIPDQTPDPAFDVVASDFLDLAHQLGA